ncbi:MAG: aminoglycoside phosphotransferase family protein [Clostridium sp.]|nr:aminoglycoside phosphotransferase family protein [Clostridium sp.]
MKQLPEGLEKIVTGERFRAALGLPERIEEQYDILAQGEYNRNFLFTHPVTGQRLVLRLNFGSQMHLEHQIEYEYQALRLLETSGRTPKPLYVDGSRKYSKQGFLVMEFLPGRPLDYRKDLLSAAECLADIHSTGLPEKHGLICPKKPLQAILEECEEMVKTYMDSNLGDMQTKRTIRRLLDQGWKQADRLGEVSCRRCINTELNSTNFLVNGPGKKTFLIDWEKPLYGDPAQDLGHFLAPTTTFWKTDVMLSREEREAFVTEYIRSAEDKALTEGVRERTRLYLPITCLRGITWCAMAWVQYRKPGRELVNESTRKKLDQYLDAGFLAQIGAMIEGERDI